MMDSCFIAKTGAIAVVLLSISITTTWMTLFLYPLVAIGGFFVAPWIWCSDLAAVLQDTVLRITKFDAGGSGSPTKRLRSPPKPTPMPLLLGPCRRTRSASIAVSGPPWETLRVPVTVNDALERLILELIDRYVNRWYRTEFGNDQAFVHELLYQVRFAGATLVRALRETDYCTFVADDLVPLALLHVDHVSKTNGRIAGDQLHAALESPRHEEDYLRVAADFFVERLFDASRIGGRADDFEFPSERHYSNRRWPSQCVRHLLRELVLSSVLKPALEFFSDPDTLNSLVLIVIDKIEADRTPKMPLAFDPTVTVEPPSSRFLSHLNEASYQESTDSLLGLKLSDVVREPRLLQIFYIYLRDMKGPAHFLDCFLQAHDLHNHINKAKNDARLFEEIHSDAWQLYSDYIHESAPQLINFEDDEIPEAFHDAVDRKDLELLKKVTEDVYRELYQRLNAPYVTPFCQSECFLGHLCGAPPAVVELIRDPGDAAKSKRAPVLERTFSLSQFRNRFFSAFAKAVSEEEDEPGRLLSLPGQDIENGDIALIDLGRDLNKWAIQEVRVEPRKDSAGRIFYLFVVSIERLDLSSADLAQGLEDLPTIWAVARKYEEFYILEQKIREFHGPSIKVGTLPDKRILQPRNRVFMEAQTNLLRQFLQALVCQPGLRNSELVFAFLTSEEEFRDDLPLFDLNPLRAMRRVPSKLQRERGQNLKPFLLNMMAGILAPSSFSVTEPPQAPSASFSMGSTTDDSISVKSVSSAAASQVSSENDPSMASEDLREYRLTSITPPSWIHEPANLLALFVVQIVGSTSRAVLAGVYLVVKFFTRVLDALIHAGTARVLAKVTHEDTVVAIITSIRELLTSDDAPQPASGEERSLRAQLAERRLDDFVADNLPSCVGRPVRQAAKNIIHAVQHPRANRQLVFVLLDAIVQKIKKGDDDILAQLGEPVVLTGDEISTS